MADTAAIAPSSSGINADGPVLNLINKRLRALRKKLNRISRMEEFRSQGKILNREQEESLRSKSSVISAIDELEKLRQPLSQALDQEIQLAYEKNNVKREELTNKRSIEDEIADLDANDEFSAVSDLLGLVYFGTVFDVQSLMREHENLLTRTHERNCCLTYDYVTDDDNEGDPLKEEDLDLIAIIGSLLTSRPVNSCLSHKNALEKCVEHAKLWIANSNQPIEPNSSITYAYLKKKLERIIASDYFTTAPQMKSPFEVASAIGTYTSFQVPQFGSFVLPLSEDIPGQLEYSGEEYDKEEEEPPNSHDNEIYNDETVPAEELHLVGRIEGRKYIETPGQTEVRVPVSKLIKNVDLKEQQYANLKSYQNYRGDLGGGGHNKGMVMVVEGGSPIGVAIKM